MAAGAYIADVDVNDLWGTINIDDWSDLASTKTRDDARVQRAIDYAEQRVNNRFRHARYAIPFVFNSGIDEVLKYWVAAIAGQWLYQARGLRDEAAGERIAIIISGDKTTGEIGVFQEMGRYVAGQAFFDAATVETQPRAPVVVG